MRRNLTTTGWIVFAAAVAVYLVMVLWSLPFIAAEAKGEVPFDLRPMGYNLNEANAFLSALSARGREFYHSVQHRLDLAYPALLALALGIGSGLTAPRTWRSARWLLVLLPLIGMAADYRENALVSDLLEAQLPLADAALVDAASRVTVVKSIATTLAMFLFLTLLVMWIVRKRRANA